MLLRLMIIALALIAFVFAAENEDGCEPHLRSGFVNVLAIGYKRQQLKLADIEALAASATPYNPLKHIRPGTRNGALKRSLDTTLQLMAPKQWPSVQRDLRAWIQVTKQKEGIALEASSATAKLFIPSVAGSFAKDRFNENDSGAFAYTNEQGRLMGVFLRGPHKGLLGTSRSFLELTDLEGQTPMVSLNLGLQHQTTFSAWTTPEKHLRVAYISNTDELKLLAYPDAENSESIPLYDDPSAPVAASLASPVLVTKNGRRLIAIANRGRVQVRDLNDPRPILFSWSTDYLHPDLKLFETSRGRLLFSFTENRMLRVFEIGGDMLLTQNRPTIISSQSWWESQDGEVYLSSLSGGEYQVYLPLKRPAERIWISEQLKPGGRPENHWFRAPNGHDYNYVLSSEQRGVRRITEITTFDVTTKQKVFSRESPSFLAGSPIVAGGVHGDPRVVLYNGTGSPGIFSIVNPIDESFSTVELKLEVPNGAIGIQTITRLTNPLGEDALLLSDRFAGTVLNLFNRSRP